MSPPNTGTLPFTAAPLAAPAGENLAAGLRDLAKAVDHIHDLKTFLQLLQIGLVKTGVCAEADFALQTPGERTDAFKPGHLTAPIMAGSAVLAVAPFAPRRDKHHFDAEDIQILSSLSELVSASVDLSCRLSSDRKALAALKAVLSLAPVGICAIDQNGRVEAINTLARGWLALAEGDNVASALPPDTSVEELRTGTSFHLRISGRLLFCEARPQQDSHFAALVMTDLTPEQGRLLDALGREVYRGNHLRRPLQFLLLESTQPIGALVGLISTLRAKLGRSAIIGPYDAARIAAIFPDLTWPAVLKQLRELADVLMPMDVCIGRSELIGFDETPEVVITRALANSARLADLTRPRVLVHDGYGAVGESLKLVLGGTCEVLGSTDPLEARRLVDEQHFDAIVAESHPNTFGLELVAAAKARNANVRSFLLSSLVPESNCGQTHAWSDVPVFSKPFNVEQVRDTVLASLRFETASSPAQPAS